MGVLPFATLRRVAAYDETVPGAYEIEARASEGAVAFDLAEASVYDIFIVGPPTEAEEPAGEAMGEPVAFERSMTVSGVTVTVKAEGGCSRKTPSSP